MDLLLMGLLVFAGAGGGYVVGRDGRRGARRVAAEAALETRFVALSERLAKDREELEWRFGVIDAALGRHSDYGQELRDGLEAVKGDLDQRLAGAVAALQERNAEIDAALGRHAVNSQELADDLQRLDAMGAVVNEQWAQQLQELRTLLEEQLDAMGTRLDGRLKEQQAQLTGLDHKHRRYLEDIGKRLDQNDARDSASRHREKQRDQRDQHLAQQLRERTASREELEKLQAQLDEVSPALVVRFQAMLDQQVLLLRDRTVGREELEKLQPQLDYLRDCTVSRKEMAQLQTVVERLEKATGNVTGNAGRIEALELAQGLNDGRLAQLEGRLAEATSHMANLAQDTLAAIGELKGELAGELETMGDRVEKVDADQQQLLALLEQRLGEVQDFIIKAADDAKARREGLQSSPLPPVGGVAELLQQQQALQQAFRQRRPAVAAVFPTVPREVGL